MSSTAMPPALADSGAQLLNLRQIASLLGCSTRHVVRLAETQRCLARYDWDISFDGQRRRLKHGSLRACLSRRKVTNERQPIN